MLKKLLALDPSQEVDGIDLAFRGGLVFALVLIAISIAFAVYLYRSERHLPKGRRMVMMICQVTALLGLIITLFVIIGALVAAVVLMIRQVAAYREDVSNYQILKGGDEDDHKSSSSVGV